MTPRARGRPPPRGSPRPPRGSSSRRRQVAIRAPAARPAWRLEPYGLQPRVARLEVPLLGDLPLEQCADSQSGVREGHDRSMRALLNPQRPALVIREDSEELEAAPRARAAGSGLAKKAIISAGEASRWMTSSRKASMERTGTAERDAASPLGSVNDPYRAMLRPPGGARPAAARRRESRG